MDEYNRWNYQVPAFGSWDYEEDNLPYTQCFESARQDARIVRYGSYNSQGYAEDRDLYVAGDLYQNDIVTPAVIVIPRRRGKGYPNVKAGKKQQQERIKKEEWGGSYGYSYDIKEAPSPIISPPKYNNKSKAVDEDLYKVPPEYLHVKPKRRGGFFTSCLMPICT